MAGRVMGEMNILVLRTNSCAPDPRVEKEVNSLISNPEYSVKILCWDRDGRKGTFQELLIVSNGAVPIRRFGIPASWGGGMRANFFPMLKFEWKLFWWLLIHGKEYDVIHACDLLTGLPAWLPCKLLRKKLVYDIFDYYAATQSGPKWILNLFRKLENWVINASDTTIICSEKRREQICGSKPKKLVVIHNSPSKKQITAAIEQSIHFKKPDHPIKIAYVGNLVEDRFLLQALASAARLPEIEFHIGGFGVLEDKIARLATEQDNIHFYGRLPYRKVLELECSCHIMLALYDPSVPNHVYAAPNKFYEALALGKPLVMFRNTGMADIVERMDIGAVCEPTEDSITEALIHLIDRKQEWETVGARMQMMFHERYSWEIMERRLLELYEGIK